MSRSARSAFVPPQHSARSGYALGLLPALLCVAAGCGSRDETNVTGLLGELSLVTFNTALGIGLAEYPSQRLEAIERDLPLLDADVLCLQEVWQLADVQRLAASLAHSHPYAHWSVTPADPSAAAGGAACSQAEADLLLACLQDNCSGLTDEALPICAITNCADDFTGVSTGCQQCVFANQQEDPVDIARICSDDSAVVAAFQQQNGLMLLSRYPLTDPDFRAMDSSLGDRGILSARLGPSLGASVDVLCSHLTPTFSNIPYTGRFGSWQAERDYHIQTLLDAADARDTGGALALLGDMNCGPETALARGAGPAAFAHFIDAGYTAPYAQSAAPACTFCAANPLVGDPRGGEDTGAILDHVLLAGLPEGAEVSTERVMDDGIVIVDAGNTVQSSHSDHYGVRVSIALPEAPQP